MKRCELFLQINGGILLAAALERFMVAAGDAQALSLPEPMLGIPLRLAVLLTAVLELAVALVCLFGHNMELRLGLLAWLTTNYSVIWIALVWQHCSPQGSCIGSLTDPLRLSHGIIRGATEWLPIFLLAGSYAAVIWLWLNDRQKAVPTAVKISCPACGVHIQFASSNLGRVISCPQCHADITLRRPQNLKTSCFFCQGHIEFPSHAIGTKMRCPHCSMDITLKAPALGSGNEPQAMESKKRKSGNTMNRCFRFPLFRFSLLLTLPAPARALQGRATSAARVLAAFRAAACLRARPSSG